MPSVVQKTIGTGGDYSTWGGFVAALPNLPAVDEIWHALFLAEVHTGGLTLSGVTTDATRYVIIDAAPGASFADHPDKETNPQRYNASVGAAISGGVNISVPHTRLRRLQIRETSWGNWTLQVHAAGCVLDSLIVEGTNADRVIQWGSSGGGSISNVLGIQDFETGQPAFVSQASNAVYADNVTIVRPTNKPGGGAPGFLTAVALLRLRNCAGFGFDRFCDSYSSVAGSSNNASDKVISFGTDNQASQAYADQFEVISTAGGTHDFRRKAGSALEGAGLDLSGVVDTDIIGRPRASPFDIGAWGSAEALPTRRPWIFPNA